MDLFGPEPARNLLPCDGEVHYHGAVLDAAEARRCFADLQQQVPWQPEEVVLFGRRIVTSRLVAWYGDNGCLYRYSGTTKQALPWNGVLLELKNRVEERCAARFNACLLNFYHHGGEGMGWHSDDEAALARQAPIASLSLGAERSFRFKHKHRPAPPVSVRLEHGSLLVMRGATQSHWLHCLPKSKRVTEPRINLTFRVMAAV